MDKKHLPEKIIGDRIYLKKHSLDLAQKMSDYVVEDRARLAQYLPWPQYIKTVQDEIDFIKLTHKQWDEHTVYAYGIFTQVDDVYVGNIDIHAISWGWEKCEIGYWILGRFEGQGLMIDATKTLCRALFDHGFNRVEILCDPNNLRSGNIPRALGFRFEARLAEFIKDGSGRHQNMHVFAKLKSQGTVQTVQIKKVPQIKSQNLTLRLPEPIDIQKLIEYFKANESHLANSTPMRKGTFDTETFWKERIPLDSEDFFADRALRLFAFDRDSEREVMGSIEFSQIARGPFQACYLGYNIAARHQGKGLMFEALTSALRYAFEDLNLHRIMANHLPENLRSAALLKRLGFEKEGLAKNYLKMHM